MGGFVAGSLVAKKTGKKISVALKGRKLSEEHKKNISKGLKGRIVSVETREKISKANMGKTSEGHPQSEETRRKISVARKGMKFSKEHCKNISKSQKGKIISEETRKKLSKSLKGRFFSKTHRERISAALQGHSVSEKMMINARKNLRYSQKGIKRSEEHCEKLADGVSKAYIEGRLTNNIRKNRMSDNEYAGVRFRSSWELKVAKWLVKNKMPWEYEAFRFKCSNNRYYIPDFKLSDNEFIEVKGLLTDDDVFKMDEFVEAGFILYYIDKDNINNISLDKVWKCHSEKTHMVDLEATMKVKVNKIMENNNVLKGDMFELLR